MRSLPILGGAFNWAILAACFIASFGSANSQSNPPAAGPYDLNGEWRSLPVNTEGTARADRIIIQEIAQDVLATEISEGATIPVGEIVFRGTYSASTFEILQDCRHVRTGVTLLQRESLTVLDATHLRFTTTCPGSNNWVRAGPNTIVIDAADLFDFDSAKLEGAGRDKLQKVAATLAALHPNSGIRVSGFTDNQGTPAHNTQLSTFRARAVANWLGDHGIPKARISATGYGVKNPRYPNTTEQGRAHNRRIEIEIQP